MKKAYSIRVLPQISAYARQVLMLESLVCTDCLRIKGYSFKAEGYCEILEDGNKWPEIFAAAADPELFSTEVVSLLHNKGIKGFLSHGPIKFRMTNVESPKLSLLPPSEYFILEPTLFAELHERSYLEDDNYYQCNSCGHLKRREGVKDWLLNIPEILKKETIPENSIFGLSNDYKRPWILYCDEATADCLREANIKSLKLKEIQVE